MFRKSPLGLAIAALIAAPFGAQAEVEVSAELKNETAFFLQSGQVTGEAATMLDNSEHDAGDVMKFENSARIFINGDLGESSSWHAELRPVYDAEGVNSYYKGHENYTQNDWLRELYADTRLGGWDLRLGKQQVVWGTADGIKLLDIINPTDFRELNQNAMEDSRIPVWMVNAETNFDNGGNLQLIVAQREENKIPGLNDNDDSGHPFIMKGVDSITGNVNGFYHIAPALSNVAATFNAAAMGGAFTGGNFNPAGLTPFGGLTVDGFASSSWNVTTPGLLLPGTNPTPDETLQDPTNMPGYVLLNNFAQNGFTGQPGFPVKDPNGNYNTTNLMAVTGEEFFQVDWRPDDATSAFEYMSNATFATFNTFTKFDPNSPTGLSGTESEWKKDYSDNPNIGGRFRGSMDNGLNYSLNYFYHYSANPAVDLSWRSNSGEKLTVQRAPTVDAGGGMYVPDASQSLTRDQALANWNQGSPTTILVHDKAGNYYGAIDPTTMDGTPGAGAPILRFTEYSDRVHSLGASFDYAMDAGDLPIVLRGEFLYDKDEKQPVVDRFLLSIGDLTNALKMEEADYFKYVLGADVTVLTNLLVSAQFIQFRNLDYVDQSDKCVTMSPAQYTVNCGRYTADFATLHLTNDLNKAYKNKEFYSLFLSKPFGPNQLGRVNNIVIYEEGGGWWDRLDAEYSLTDQLIIGGEINVYWGEDDTTFGQFDKSSNVQVSLKYIIE